MALHDALTKLANRRLLDQALGQALASSGRTGLHGALMFLDLDNFKPLNDSCGHDVGDTLLIEVAQTLAVPGATGIRRTRAQASDLR